MPAHWIDFKQLRAKLRFQDVLSHYRIEAKSKGDRATALCSLPGHPSRNDGKKRTPSLSIHLGKGIWRCFGCGQSGNVLDFVSRMEGLNPDDPQGLRQAALKAIELFHVGDSTRPGPPKKSEAKVVESEQPVSAAVPLPVVVNAPLDFELKHLEPNHPYLLKRGFTTETIAHFGLGFCAKGMMKDRIAIPIHDQTAQLVGYAGRLIDDDKVGGDTPKYLFPGSRERNGMKYEFHKAELLYNAHRQKMCKELIVVEGFASVWWLHQNGFPNVVAVMGSSISECQTQLIVDLLEEDGRVWILSDADPAGEELATAALRSLSVSRWCRWVRYDPAMQPTDLSAEELTALL